MKKFIVLGLTVFTLGGSVGVYANNTDREHSNSNRSERSKESKGNKEEMESFLENKGLTLEDLKEMTKEERDSLMAEHLGVDVSELPVRNGKDKGNKEEMESFLESKGLTLEDLKEMTKEERDSLMAEHLGVDVSELPKRGSKGDKGGNM